jgi:hypothetical protein
MTRGAAPGFAACWRADGLGDYLWVGVARKRYGAVKRPHGPKRLHVIDLTVTSTTCLRGDQQK